MASRKGSMIGSIQGTGLAPRQQQNLQPQFSTEYLEAINVLSEETMYKACELALQDDDDDNNDNDTSKTKNEKSSLEQLRDLYATCRKAAKVIEKEAKKLSNTTTGTAPSIPMMTNATTGSKMNAPPPLKQSISSRTLSGGTATSTKAGNTTTPAAIITTPTIPALAKGKTTAIPNRRMMANKARLPPGKTNTAVAIAATGNIPNNNNNNNKRSGIERQKSDSSVTSNNNKKSRNNNNNMRNHINSSSNNNESFVVVNSSSTEKYTPPPSVIQFLAKLSKDKSSSKTYNNDNNSNTKNKTSSSPTKSTSTPPIRTQPSRASRK